MAAKTKRKAKRKSEKKKMTLKQSRAAYEVARGVSVMARVKPKRNYRLELLPAWEDLTQREQEEWIAAAGDVLQNFIDR